MSLECLIGPEGNLLSTEKENAHRLRLQHPILSNEEFLKIKNLQTQGWRTKTIDITYEKESGSKGLIKALNRICKESEEAIKWFFLYCLI